MKNKLGTLITLGVVAVIALAVIIMYFAKVTYMPAMTNPTAITVYQTSTKSATFTKTEQESEYYNILNSYNQSFQQNFLSALFAGQTQVAGSLTSGGQLRTTTSAPAFSTYLVLDFEEQKIVVQGHQQNVSVDQVIVQIQNTTTFSETTVYFKQVSEYSNQSATYYTMKTLANQAQIYKLITELVIA